jgi:hypothetical protein
MERNTVLLALQPDIQALPLQDPRKLGPLPGYLLHLSPALRVAAGCCHPEWQFWREPPAPALLFRPPAELLS